MILACSPPGLGGCVCGEPADPGDDLAGAAVQDVQPLRDHPVFHGRVAGGVEAPGGLPQVFQHVDEVDHDGQGDAAGGGGGLDQAELVVVPVHQGDPGPGMAGVAAVGLVEDLADGDVAAGRDVAGVPAVLRPRRAVVPAAGVRAHDLLRGARPGRPGRRRRRRTRSRPSACSLSSPRSRPASRRSAPAAPGPWSGGGAPPGSIATPLPSAEIASGGRPCPWPAPAAGPAAWSRPGPGRTAPRPRPRPR